MSADLLIYRNNDQAREQLLPISFIFRRDLLNPVRHGPPVALIPAKAHKHPIHVGAEDLIGPNHDLPLIRADYHWPFAAGQARQGQRHRQQ